jgi:hypothetical protein
MLSTRMRVYFCRGAPIRETPGTYSLLWIKSLVTVVFGWLLAG